MARHTRSYPSGWQLILMGYAALLTPTSVALAETRTSAAPTVKLVGLQQEHDGAASIKLVGHFVLQNNADRDLCLMRDMLENEFSPYVLVPKKVGRSRFKYAPGVPFPPTTTAVTKLSPGASTSFKRVVYFAQPTPQPRSVRLRVEPYAWWCEGGGRLQLRSDPFSPTPIEPQ